MNGHTKRWEYLRLHRTLDDEYVVPYHPAVLLLWGAHINVQRVTNAAWSAYMLKYAMKSEPVAQLNLKVENLRRLGISPEHATDRELKLACASVLSQPVSTTPEAAWIILGYDIVTFSWKDDYVYTSSPETRTAFRNTEWSGGIVPRACCCVHEPSAPPRGSHTISVFRALRLGQTQRPKEEAC